MTAIGDAVFSLDDVLDAQGVPYAISGALALAYYAEPRATADVDLRVGTEASSGAALLDALSAAGWQPPSTGGIAPPEAGAELERPGRPGRCDLFFSFDPFHADVLDRAVRRPLVNGDDVRRLPFVAVDDYVVLKLSFSRPKDWVDVAAVLEAGTAVDAEYVERQLLAFRGPTFSPHVARLRRMIEDRRQP